MVASMSASGFVSPASFKWRLADQYVGDELVNIVYPG